MSEKENQFIEMTSNLINSAETIPEEIHREKSEIAHGILEHLNSSRDSAICGLAESALGLVLMGTLPREFSTSLLLKPELRMEAQESIDGVEMENDNYPSVVIAERLLNNPRCLELLIRGVQGI